jgi:hypothetical protein
MGGISDPVPPAGIGGMMLPPAPDVGGSTGNTKPPVPPTIGYRPAPPVPPAIGCPPVAVPPVPPTIGIPPVPVPLVPATIGTPPVPVPPAGIGGTMPPVPPVGGRTGNAPLVPPAIGCPPVAEPPAPAPPPLAPPPSSFDSSPEEHDAPRSTTTLPTRTYPPLRRDERRPATGGDFGGSVSEGRLASNDSPDSSS